MTIIGYIKNEVGDNIPVDDLVCRSKSKEKQVDLEDWLRENPTNNDDTRKTKLEVDSKKETTTQTNSDDTIKCKDCNYSDEFCASGDCPNDTSSRETLTEQWKKGELESGYYFFKTKDNIEIGFLYEGLKYPYDRRHNTIDDIEEVLAPVPSYEEWQQLRKFLEEFNALDVAKENQQLKKLLKEWREHLKDTKCDRCQNLIRRTDNAIGEKK